MRCDALLLSCEHGGNQVPLRYQHLFASKLSQRALSSHRGFDAGALSVAIHLKRLLGAPLHQSRVSRLLVDLNRSHGHRAMLSEFSTGLDRAERARLFARHYTPHREQVEEAIGSHAALGRQTLHLAIHSFTPRLGGHTRNADIGLLYDPRRAFEKEVCRRWQRELESMRPELRVRRNYPYRGNTDGLTSSLRRRFGDEHYLGIEVELNQRLVGRPGSDHLALAQVLALALGRSLSRILDGKGFP